ncbi:MAG TPA: HAD family hydrolase [Crinalium sp.]|jgi:phosphoglycolate phosphatase-like HAD superfamily hydrolase
MPEPKPTLLALDFDGVICDGLIEYFKTAWRAYCQLWKPHDEIPPPGLAEQFYRLRPVVESGWEMPLVLRSLLLGQSEAEILVNWGAIAQALVADEHLVPAELSATVDRIRDEWIAADLEDWLSQHRFYPGIIERLRQTLASPVQTVIITTKEGRFVRQLLQQQQVDLAESQIFGKEVRQPKSQTLRDLQQKLGRDGERDPQIWFVEDRLKTLQSIYAQPDLQTVRLFLGDWGYNTSADREAAQQDERITLLSLAEFAQDFAEWI